MLLRFLHRESLLWVISPVCFALLGFSLGIPQPDSMADPSHQGRKRAKCDANQQPPVMQRPMFIRAYLRASTPEQDSSRALESLRRFANDHGNAVAATYPENVSGATTDRPELIRLLNDSLPGDVLLVESIDRLTRLSADDWSMLRSAINSRGLRIVALDLPTSHQGMTKAGDEFTDRMLTAINSMLIDMMAAIARKDYEQRRARQAQGIEKAKAAGKYQGKAIDRDLHRRVKKLLGEGIGIRPTARLAQCSPTTVHKIKKQMDRESVGHPTDKTLQRPTS